MIQFLLNETPVSVESCSPSLTVLDWLRTTKGKTGTKEGCATGDCGACTLLIGEQVSTGQSETKWQYKTLNSCLMLLGNAHGKHIVTVEALTTSMQVSLQQLHPVQRAMVECHGSQCGFCTPGIVMSLLALYINNESYPGSSATIHALGGNLCRCTGYSPILKAAEKAFEYERVEQPWSLLAKQFNETLIQANTSNTIPQLTDKGRIFYLPQSAEQLVKLKSSVPTASLVAGGTDLALELSQNLLLPDDLISVSQVVELNKLEQTDTALEIGAALPYSDFVDTLLEQYPEAKELFERLGSMQVRNSGTLGGSLANASPIGDPAPLLIALNATMDLASTSGVRTIPVEEFFIDYRKTLLKPDEVITKVTIPNRNRATKLACHKISKRFEDDISTVCLVLAVEQHNNQIKSARCALGGMAAIPKRASHVEKHLIGKPMKTNSFVDAGTYIKQDFSPLTDVRASSEYRLQVSENLMHRIGYEFCQTATNANSMIDSKLRIAHASL